MVRIVVPARNHGNVIVAHHLMKAVDNLDSRRIHRREQAFQINAFLLACSLKEQTVNLALIKGLKVQVSHVFFGRPSFLNLRRLVLRNRAAICLN